MRAELGLPTATFHQPPRQCYNRRMLAYIAISLLGLILSFLTVAVAVIVSWCLCSDRAVRIETAIKSPLC